MDWFYLTIIVMVLCLAGNEALDKYLDYRRDRDKTNDRYKEDDTP